MSWAKLDDRFLMNPKIMSAGLEGRALYVAGILYCAGELTDGKIPLAAVRKLAVLSDVEDAEAAAQRLVNLGLWERDAATGGYTVHDFLEYNPPAAAVQERKQDVSQKRADAGSRGAARRWQTNGKQTSKDDKSDSKPVATASTPDGKPIAKSIETHGKRMANAWQNDSKADGKTMAPREDGKPMAPSPSPSPKEEDGAIRIAPGAFAPPGGHEVSGIRDPTGQDGTPGTEGITAQDGIAVFCERFKAKFGENPDIPPKHARQMKELVSRVGPDTLDRAVAGFFSDPWPSESGYSVSIFLSQPMDRWTRAAAPPPKNLTKNQTITSGKNGMSHANGNTTRTYREPEDRIAANAAARARMDAARAGPDARPDPEPDGPG